MAEFGARLDANTTSGGITVRDMLWQDPYVILAERGYVTIFDMSEPTNIDLASRTAVGSGYVPGAILIDPTNSKHVYLINSHAKLLRSFDITDPAAPVLNDFLVLSAGTGSFLTDLAKHGDYVYLPGWLVAGPTWHHIGIVNVSDPTNIVEEAIFTDSTNLAGTPTGILVDPTDTYLFVSSTTRFSVFTFSGATLVFNNSTGIAGSVSDISRMAQTNDGYVYVKDYFNDRLHIIDTRDPTNVSEVAVFTDNVYLNGVRRIQIIGNILYAMNFTGLIPYVTAYSISDRTAPVRTKSLDLTADAPWGVAGGRIGGFVVSEEGQLYVGRHTTSTARGIASYNAVAPPDALRRISGLHHVYRPGSFRLEATLGDVSTTTDIASAPERVKVRVPEPTEERWREGGYSAEGAIGHIEVEVPQATAPEVIALMQEMAKDVMPLSADRLKPENLWQRITPWKEEEGATLGSEISRIWQSSTPWQEDKGETFGSEFGRIMGGGLREVEKLGKTIVDFWGGLFK